MGTELRQPLLPAQVRVSFPSDAPEWTPDLVCAASHDSRGRLRGWGTDDWRESDKIALHISPHGGLRWMNLCYSSKSTSACWLGRISSQQWLQPNDA